MFLRLSRECTLGGIAVSVSFAVFFVGVLHADFAVHEVLAVHISDSVVGGVEGGVGDEAVVFAEVGVVAGDFGGRDEGAEAREGFVEGFFVHHCVQASDVELGAYAGSFAAGADAALVCACFVDADGFAVEADLVHDFAGVVCVVFAREFYESVALVGLRYAVFGEVDVDDGARLEHQFPDEGIGAAFVEVADVEGAVFVLVVVAGRRHGGGGL